MSDSAVLDIFRNAVVPIVTIGTSLSLFWWKFYADSRKRLDDLLIELEHKIHGKGARDIHFHDAYLEIRKAATEYERWIISPVKKKALTRAMQGFRGQAPTDPNPFELIGSPHQSMVDVFLTGYEVRCLPPPTPNLAEYVNRIADIRKVTGSRRWEERSPVVV